MARGWAVLDLTHDERELHYQRGRLEVRHRGEVLGGAALADLAVVLIGPRTLCTSGALERATANDVSVLICDWRGVPVGGAYGWSDNTRVGARQRAQVEMSLPRRKNAWGRLVRAKILGQAHTLDLVGSSRASTLRDMAASVRSGDPDNREAQAARIYWSGVFDRPQFSRTPGYGDQENAFLNYTYTILRGHAIRAVLAAGLHPAVAVFHHGRGNNFALVDDLIEPFRPAVDFAVAQLPFGVDFDLPEVRRTLVESCRVGFGQGHRLTTELDGLAQQFARYAELEVDRLPVPTWTGPDEPNGDE